jgi:hypothetical protein
MAALGSLIRKSGARASGIDVFDCNSRNTRYTKDTLLAFCKDIRTLYTSRPNGRRCAVDYFDFIRVPFFHLNLISQPPAAVKSGDGK